MPNTQEPKLRAWDAPRKCDYCDLEFKPARPQDKKMRFCCDNHRKDFFRYGAKLRIVAALRRDLGNEMRALERRIEALEKKASKRIDKPILDSVTLQHENAQ